MPGIKDLTGLRFGRLTAVRLLPDRVIYGGKPFVVWECLCDCGNSANVIGQHLVQKNTFSCGCLRREVAKRPHPKATAASKEFSIKHGRSHSTEYSSWGSMIQRCTNPNDPAFSYYGGRGVTFCDAWKDFTAFFRDMGPRPSGTSLDRINPYGNYEPGNCRWADRVTQANNTRRKCSKLAAQLEER